MRGEPAAVCREVTKIYRRASGDTRALDEVEAVIPAGRLTVLMGPSGSGKSTLLRIIAGLDSPTSGSVEVGDAWLSTMNRRKRRSARRTGIGFVFQRPSENLISYLTVAEHMQLAAGIRKAGRAEIDDTLSALGIDHRAGNRPDELSGGEQQRLAFAQAVIGSPALLVADEPTAELDADSTQALISLLHHLTDEGRSIVVATHDPEVAAVADVVITLDEGRVVG